MRARKFILSVVLLLIGYGISANASSLGDIRVNARFLTDRMAFELNLNQDQYNDLFEINFDFLTGVDPYLAGMARADAHALDMYYRYLDERNDDLRWILSSSAYSRFLGIEYFFRPIYAVSNVCYLRVYKIYPNRSFFYFGRPVHYLTYRGAHSRRFYKGVGFYRTHYPRHYHHPVYKGDYRCRPEYRKHDFVVPRPVKHPGTHVVPVRPPVPSAPSHRPGNRPSHRPSAPALPPHKPVPPVSNRPSRPEHGHSGKPSSSRPSQGRPRPAVRPSKPERPASKHPVRQNKKEGEKRQKQIKEKSFLRTT